MRAHLDGRPCRHDRAWLRPSWTSHLTAPLRPEAQAALVEWFARGRPAMVRGRDPVDGTGVALRVTLPAARWFANLPLAVGRAALEGTEPPLTLAEAIPSAPEPWRDPLADLDRAADHAGVPLSVGGAMAWQHLTGEPYLTRRSPVELLFRPRTRRQLEAILAVLRDREGRDGPPLAGEAVFGWDDAVAWRDLLRGRRRVVVRGTETEAVVDVDRLLAGLR